MPKLKCVDRRTALSHSFIIPFHASLWAQTAISGQSTWTIKSAALYWKQQRAPTRDRNTMFLSLRTVFI